MRAALFTVALTTGCAGTQRHVLTFDPGELAERTEELSIEVREARYEERRLTLTCSIHNPGTTVVSVGPQGLLLQDHEVEVPLAEDPNLALPERIEIGPKGTESLTLAFDVGALEPVSRALVVRAWWSDETPREPLRIGVPGITTES